MEGTRNYFAGATITDGTAAEHTADWIEMVKRYGVDRFEAALVQARRWQIDPVTGERIPRRFFPMPSEIEAFIPAAPSQTKFADPDCPKCGGNGMLIVNRVAFRCACKTK